MALRNLRSVVANYRTVGIDRFVVAHSPKNAEEVARLAEAMGMTVRSMKLTVPIEEIERRLAADPTRTPRGLRGGEEVDRRIDRNRLLRSNRLQRPAGDGCSRRDHRLVGMDGLVRHRVTAFGSRRRPLWSEIGPDGRVA